MELMDDEELNSIQSSPKKMLGRLRDAASLAIQVTIGRKLALTKQQTTNNIITGFGYSMVDIFENQYVDMDTIVQSKNGGGGMLSGMQEIEEVQSPFASPKKRRMGSLSKDEYKKKRKEERRREMEDFERREREAPKQYSLVKIKTSAGRYPVINYISQFTADEIYEGKKCLLNQLRRPHGLAANSSPFASPEKRRGRKANFSLNIHATDEASPDKKAAAEEQQNEEEKKQLVEPQSRSTGGVWIATSDIPHSFQNFIVYHNVAKMNHVQSFTDRWVDAAQPYIANEKDVVIKLELDEETLKQHQAEYQATQNARLEAENKFLPGIFPIG